MLPSPDWTRNWSFSSLPNLSSLCLEFYHQSCYPRRTHVVVLDLSSSSTIIFNQSSDPLLFFSSSVFTKFVSQLSILLTQPQFDLSSSPAYHNYLRSNSAFSSILLTSSFHMMSKGIYLKSKLDNINLLLKTFQELCNNRPLILAHWPWSTPTYSVILITATLHPVFHTPVTLQFVMSIKCMDFYASVPLVILFPLLGNLLSSPFPFTAFFCIMLILPDLVWSHLLWEAFLDCYPQLAGLGGPPTPNQFSGEEAGGMREEEERKYDCQI